MGARVATARFHIGSKSLVPVSPPWQSSAPYEAEVSSGKTSLD